MLRRVMLTAAVVSFLSAAATRADGPPQPNSHTSAAEATASTTPAYADGRRDRLTWVDWFNALAIGSYRDGAFWWAREHSKEQPRGCVSRSGNVEWEMGCKAAQQRLAVTDIRLKAEPAYSLGWSSQTASDIPPEAITLSPTERMASSASPYADGLRDRQAWENWLGGFRLALISMARSGGRTNASRGSTAPACHLPGTINGRRDAEPRDDASPSSMSDGIPKLPIGRDGRARLNVWSGVKITTGRSLFANPYLPFDGKDPRRPVDDDQQGFRHCLHRLDLNSHREVM